MVNIVLTRIDNRLVHGQVGISWVKGIGANLIVVANDEAAEDLLQQSLMSLTADNSGVGIRFFTVEKTIHVISQAADHQKIFLVVKDTADTRRLVEGGVPIKEVNLGNLHHTEGKVPFTKKVYLDDADRKNLDFIKAKGIRIFAQDVPGEKQDEY